ncbi:hypothetical protein MKS83_21745 [Chryseobacterium sp. Y16C]|uniref:hypothetical protein n=1 Tax=Chryseobacterium sp. Y16C TaxID=2920939 RepID=UPI001F0A65A3|nr:hypothetical protein [Chryseobacterium sp. Y16C]UMQ41987.1 hypothetical protein MKS83_21745 [Chryseobacterium sp. Y16C]
MKDHEFAKLYHDTWNKAKQNIKKCYFPGCNEQPINSHILQKNGILNQIATNNHIWEYKINQFKKEPFYFDKTGINEIYSFDCFCKEHDDKLFEKIEKKQINFNDYESCLLFTLRTIYNEIWRKEINIEQYKLMMKSKYSSEINLEFLLGRIQQELLGIDDLRNNEEDIWEDYNNKTQNFVFQVRELNKIDICLSAFYNYETTLEMYNYKKLNGKDMPRISEVFINIFPYNNKTLLLMGYNKKDEKKLKPYVNTFFKESENKVQKKITNLLMFACETWVISEKLYKDKIEKIKDIFIACINHAIIINNEREFFNVNLFKDNYFNEMQKIKRHLVSIK